MSEGNNVEDVASKQNHEVRFEGHGIGDADTAEGQARRAEEAADFEPPEDPIEEFEGWLEGQLSGGEGVEG
jgi:hypothetical protein